jgi:8-oxo-dGTP pyrophosphatase MutT (NUDIX family)
MLTAIEEGETPEECLRREIGEELSAEIESMAVFRDYVFAGRRAKVFVVTLQADPVPNRDDFEEWGWMQPDDVKGKRFAVDCEVRIKDYLASLGGSDKLNNS